jgi:hypothetical protein
VTTGREGATIRVAYIISVYKLPEQVVRLVRSLHSETSSFFLHVDQKSDPLVLRYISAQIASLPNVHLLKRHTCYWGGFGHVAATLEGIEALRRGRAPFDYLVLLTGQDYPIKSAHQIATFFQQHRGESFLEYFQLPHAGWENGGMDRVRRWHVHLLDRHIQFPHRDSKLVRRSSPRGVTFFGGSSYWCLTRECVEYISEFVSSHPEFVRFFRYVDVPDEIFFQTIIMNSPLRRAVVNDNLRYIDWKDPDAGSPSVLTRADLPSLATSTKLFARKFDATVDSAVLDVIDRELLVDQGLPTAI